MIDGSFAIRPIDFSQGLGFAAIALPRETYFGAYVRITGGALATAIDRDMIRDGQLHGRVRLVCSRGHATLFAEVVLDAKAPLPLHMRG